MRRRDGRVPAGAGARRADARREDRRMGGAAEDPVDHPAARVWRNVRLATFAPDRPGIGAVEDGALAIRDGRTSSEVLRSAETAGEPGIAEEFAVMDRAGRVQLPREYREALHLTRRVRLALADDHVQVRSDRGGDA